MAGITFLGGNDMVGWFTTGDDIVMTGRTHTDHFVMVYRIIG